MDYLFKINRLLEEKKISKEDFAYKVGIKKQTFYNYLNGATKMSVETLKLVADGLGVPISYFFDQDEGKKIIQAGNNNMALSNNGNSNSNASRELDTCKKELEYLKKQVQDKEEIIELLKGKK